MKTRFPEAEPLIKKSFLAVKYAEVIIQGRWPEAEEYIAQNAVLASQYAWDVIKGRFHAAEDVMKADTHDNLWYSYKKEFIDPPEKYSVAKSRSNRNRKSRA